nr:PREDICTED: HORMA domain-containing protein 1-like isoform X2 [Latimeria chalumnae]|eukprot:XP_014344579.1 PREDICTED: HORMA domain-containing protein 1-like isoform X2 [Latimeria chalumnae]
MATAQKLRVDQQQATCGWAALFPNEIKTQQQSLVFVKRMMAVAVSCITYLRGIFPEDAYRTRYLEDLCIKILREESHCPGASRIVNWMKGCFDALEKRYLQIMVLGVYMDSDDPNCMIESYQFKFKYTNQGPQLDILRNQKSLTSNITTVDIKNTCILLIRKLFILMQNLEVLPNDVSLTMKLFYYDDVTPPDYQPPGFKEGESGSVWFEGIPVHVKVGEVQTPFHMLKVRVTTEKERMERMEAKNILKEAACVLQKTMEQKQEVKETQEEQAEACIGRLDKCLESQDLGTQEQSASTEKEEQRKTAKKKRKNEE